MHLNPAPPPGMRKLGVSDLRLIAGSANDAPAGDTLAREIIALALSVMGRPAGVRGADLLDAATDLAADRPAPKLAGATLALVTTCRTFTLRDFLAVLDGRTVVAADAEPRPD